MKSSNKKPSTETSNPIPVDNRKQKSANHIGPNQVSNILERVSDAIVALDSNWIYTYVNEKAAQSFGRTPDQMIGKHIWTEFPEGVGQPFYQAYYRAVETQQPITLEEYYPPYDRWFENRIYPSPDGLTIFFNDITEKKKAEQTFRDTNLYNRLLFDRSPIGLALCRMDGSLVDVNEVFAKIIGYTRDETLNLTYWDITPEKYNDQEQIQLKSLESHGEYGLYEKEYIHKDGHLVPVLLSGVMIEIANERFVLSTVEDLTHRKRQDQISQQQKAFIDSLANTIPAIIYIYDLETQSNIYSNDGIQQLLQYSPQEILKMGSDLFNRLIHPLDLPTVIDFQSKLEKARYDDVLEYEYRMQDAKGGWHWLHSYERPFLRNSDGTLKQKIGIAVDITQQKHIEQEIELERDFSSVALESLPGIFYMYDQSLTFTRWNKNFEKVSGYTGEEISRMSPLDFFTGQERTLLAERIHEVFETGSSSVTADFVSKDGSRTPHFFTGRTFSIDNQLYLIGVGIDISEQQRAQQILQRNEQILRLFVEHSPASIAMFDTEMRYLVASNRYRVDYNLGEQILIGRSHYDVFPEMPERWKEIHRRCLNGAIEKCEEDPFPRADGNVDWVRWEIRPWYEKTDKIGGVILFSEVITERKQAQDALFENEKFLSVIFENIEVGIFLVAVNQDGSYTYEGINPKHEILLGIKNEDLTGKSPQDLIPTFGEAGIQYAISLYDQCVQTKTSIESEFYVPQGPAKGWWLSKISPISDSSGRVYKLIGNGIIITDRKEAELALQESQAKLQAISSRLADMQETERKNLAKELHDRVGQNLTSLNISLNIIKSQLDVPTQENLAEAFEDTQDLLNEITDQIREVMAELHPPVLEDYGLAAALRWYADRISKQTGLRIDVVGEIIEPRLELPVSMALYRITQEALNNVIKHALASTVCIDISEKEGYIELLVEDNGRGFIPSQPTPSSQPHWGLSTMQERARAINGQMKIISSPGIGTKIIIKIPRVS